MDILFLFKTEPDKWSTLDNLYSYYLSRWKRLNDFTLVF